MAQQQQRSRRNRIDILKQILEESANGISKTKLVSRCNLNFGSIEGYLEFLIRRNFLRRIQSGSANLLLYRTTQEGSYALDAIRIAEKIIALKPDDQQPTINRHDIAADSAPPEGAHRSEEAVQPSIFDRAVLVPFEIIRNSCKYCKERTCQLDFPRHPCEANQCPLLSSPIGIRIGQANQLL